MPIDYTTDIGKVRLLICDIDEAALVLTTAQIQAFLDLEGDNVKRAAAQAIDANATNEALSSKVIKDHQLSTDGAAVANAMRKHAQSLREQALDEDDEAGVFFEIIPARGYC